MVTAQSASGGKGSFPQMATATALSVVDMKYTNDLTRAESAAIANSLGQSSDKLARESTESLRTGLAAMAPETNMNIPSAAELAPQTEKPSTTIDIEKFKNIPNLNLNNSGKVK